MLYLSMDFGTSAVKLSLVDEEKKTLAWAKKEYPYILLPGEKTEMDPHVMMQAVYDACQSLDPALRAQVGWMCYDTFSPSPVFLDENGELVYPNIITHLDRRSRAQTAEIDRIIGKDAYR